MKTKVQLLVFSIILLVTTKVTVAQGGWIIQDSLKTKITDIFFADSSHGWMLSDTDTIYHTSDGGNNWELQIVGNDYVLSAIQFADSNVGWAMGDIGTILKTTDGGTTWTTQNSGVYDLLLSIQIIDTSNIWAVGEAGVILHTTDGGLTWESKISPDETAEHQAIYFVDSLHGWVVSSYEEAGYVMRTIDGGITWTEVFHDTSYGPLRSVYFLDSLNGYVSGMEGAILNTKDGGITWTQQYIGVDGDQLRKIMFVNDNTGWASGLRGYMLYTNNAGEHWEVLPLPVSKKVMDMFFLDENHGWAVTSAGGGSGGGKGDKGDEESSGDSTGTPSEYGYLLKYDASLTAIEEDIINENIPNNFSLEQNFPNPFNPTTTIKYTIPMLETLHATSQPVQLKIYDILGKEITTLVNKKQSAGNYTVSFDASNLPSGVYIYQLQTGSFSAAKKMVLLK